MQGVSELRNRTKGSSHIPISERLSFRVPELSALSGVSEPQLYLEIARGTLKATKKGRMLLILRDDALEWLATPDAA